MLAIAPRHVVTYCTHSSTLTFQQSYTLNEVQDSAYKCAMIVIGSIK
jgi:hypothetical protein